MADISVYTGSDGISHNIRDLGAIESVTRNNDTVVVTDRGGNVTQFDVDGYTVIQQVTPETGYAATYAFQKNGVLVGSKINIPSGATLIEVSFNTVTIEDEPVEGYHVGEKYLDFVLSDDGGASHIYTNLGTLSGGGGGECALEVNDGVIELVSASTLPNADEVQY